MILVMYSNFAPSHDHLARLAGLSGGMPVCPVQSEEEALHLAPEAQIILGHRFLWQTLVHAEKVRWVQSTAAGMDAIITPVLRQRGPLLTRSTVCSSVVAFHAFAMAAALIRRLPECLANQSRAQLTRPEALLPIPQSILVLGLGEIGRAVAALMRSMGMHVVGVARSSSPDKASACDELVVGPGWHGHLGTTDILFVALPLNGETQGVISAEVMAALPAHAVIVNIGRGACMDWTAATAALLTGRLGGLAVDATDNLPDALAPIRQAPNFLLTPKMAALHPGFQPDLERFVEAQVARYFRGEPLLNEVNYADSES